MQRGAMLEDAGVKYVGLSNSSNHRLPSHLLSPVTVTDSSSHYCMAK